MQWPEWEDAKMSRIEFKLFGGEGVDEDTTERNLGIPLTAL